MSLPPVERCILRAASREDFQVVMGKPIGSFSLQTCIARTQTRLSLGERLPSSPDYPSLTVIDLTPATTCRLDDDGVATFIVLPPSRTGEDATEASGPVTESGVVSAEGDEKLTGQAEVAPLTGVGREVQVTLDETLPDGSAALASVALLEELLLPSGAVVRVGDEEASCVFPLHREPSHHRCEAAGLRVSPILFRNIRAAYVQCSRLLLYSGHPATSKGNALNYAACSFRMPADCLQCVEDSNTGEPLLVPPPDSRGAALRVDKVLLCPVIDDFTLGNALGNDYADMLATCLGAAAGRLHGRFVSQGDVLTLPMTSGALASGAHSSLDGLDACEILLKHLLHKVSEAESLWTLEDSQSPSSLLTTFRVAELRPGYGEGSSSAGIGFGFLSLDGDKGSHQTELVLVSQQRSPWLDRTPFLPPIPGPAAATREGTPSAVGSSSASYGDLASLAMDFPQQVRAAVEAACAASSGGGEERHGVIVVHGVKENLPSVFVGEAVRRVGLVPLYASAEALDDSEELGTLLAKFAATAEGVALVVRNAQVLATEHPEMLPLVGHGPARGVGGGGPRLTVLVCETVDPVVPALAARATNPDGVLECGNPSEEDRLKLLRCCLTSSARRLGFQTSLLLSYKALAAWTVGISFADLVEFAEECAMTATRVRYPATARPVLSEHTCEGVLQKYLKDHGHNLVSTKLTPVRWSDVGGLEDAKRELKETIQLPILHPEMFANGMKKRTGILFYGPPGCGKTLLAKAVATEMNMNFMSVKGPELINQYVGESERNIRLLFQRARDNSPCIVFFDELDALAPARGAKGDAGGAMDRIVSQLLVEVDGVGQTRSDGSSSGDVFIIGATNRPDLLDPSLLRPGRFDRLCYLGIPSTREEQLFALRALTRKFDLDPDVSLQELLAPLDYVYTGADFFALCSDAMMFSVEDALESAQRDIQRMTADQLQDGGESGEDDGSDDDAANAPIRVCMRHFVRARDQLKPSVTKDDLRKYEALKAKFNK